MVMKSVFEIGDLHHLLHSCITLSSRSPSLNRIVISQRWVTQELGAIQEKAVTPRIALHMQGGMLKNTKD